MPVTPCVVKYDPEVSKAFWNEAKAMLADGVDPSDVFRYIAKQYDMGTDAVGAVLNDRPLFRLTMEAWTKQANLAQVRANARHAVVNADVPPWLKALGFVYELPRKSLVVGHGGVIPFTHAGDALMSPNESGMFQDTVQRAYSYMTPNTGSARWKADMTNMVTRPSYQTARRAGLSIKLGEQPVGMGMSRWTKMSFDAVKQLRLDLFEKYSKQLEIDKIPDPNQRFESQQDLAKRINHATGVVNSPAVVNKIAGVGMFAPKLRFAKYAAAKDVFTSVYSAKRFGALAAVQLGLLGINDAVNKYILGSDDNVNWKNPGTADFLRFKIGGVTIPLSPLMETMKLPAQLLWDMLDPRVKDKWQVATRQVASAVHPMINVAYGGITGTDLATGKTLPFRGLSQRIYGDYRQKGVSKTGYPHEISGGEYAAGFAPIPAQGVVKEMVKQGAAPDTSVEFLRAYAESLLSGFMGRHAYPDVPYREKKFPKKQTGP